MNGVEHLYVHLPFCAHRCGYCDFVTAVGREDQHGAYVDALLAELAQQRVDVRAMQVVAAGRRDEVAVATAVCAERQVKVEMPHAIIRFGRATSSPLQFGQVKSIDSAHGRQKVHSCEQMSASP